MNAEEQRKDDLNNLAQQIYWAVENGDFAEARKLLEGELPKPKEE